MSNRKDARRRRHRADSQLTLNREFEYSRDELVSIFRKNSMRTLSDVRQGKVYEEDLDKLNNFIQTALALMAIVSVPTFRQAQRNAEIDGFLLGDEHSVILDSRKQEPQVSLDMDSVMYQAVKQMEK